MNPAKEYNSYEVTLEGRSYTIALEFTGHETQVTVSISERQEDTTTLLEVKTFTELSEEALRIQITVWILSRSYFRQHESLAKQIANHLRREMAYRQEKRDNYVGWAHLKRWKEQSDWEQQIPHHFTLVNVKVAPVEKVLRDSWSFRTFQIIMYLPMRVETRTRQCYWDPILKLWWTYHFHDHHAILVWRSSQPPQLHKLEGLPLDATMASRIPVFYDSFSLWGMCKFKFTYLLMRQYEVRHITPKKKKK